MKVDLGRTIRILRQAKGLSVSEAAAEAGVSVPFLSLVERGAREPSLGVLRKIAAALGVPSETLVLIALGPCARLTATEDEASLAIADTIKNLVDVEAKLKSLLGRTEAPRAAKRSYTRKHRRRDDG